MIKMESCTGATGGGRCSCRNEQNSNLGGFSGGYTTENMRTDFFSAVSAAWIKIGRLVILEYSLNRISSGEANIFAIDGVPICATSNKYPIEYHNYTNGFTVGGYIEGSRLSFYGTSKSPAGYYHGGVVYWSS